MLLARLRELRAEVAREQVALGELLLDAVKTLAHAHQLHLLITTPARGDANLVIIEYLLLAEEHELALERALFLLAPPLRLSQPASQCSPLITLQCFLVTCSVHTSVQYSIFTSAEAKSPRK